MRISIKSPESDDGIISAFGTKIFTESGVELQGIARAVVIYEPDNIVRAQLDVLVSPGNIKAHALLSLESLKEAAEHHGYNLTKAEGEGG